MCTFSVDAAVAGWQTLAGQLTFCFGAYLMHAAEVGNSPATAAMELDLVCLVGGGKRL